MIVVAGIALFLAAWLVVLLVAGARRDRVSPFTREFWL